MYITNNLLIKESGAQRVPAPFVGEGGGFGDGCGDNGRSMEGDCRGVSTITMYLSPPILTTMIIPHPITAAAPTLIPSLTFWQVIQASWINASCCQ
jgi:hypothetical protein